MNIEKHLILLNGKDRTEEVSFCKYEDSKWQIKFTKGKTYSYNYQSLEWLKDILIV